MQVFSYAPGRVFEVWTAPLRVTTLTLGPGETVTAKAAGDTVRWVVGDTISGSGKAWLKLSNPMSEIPLPSSEGVARKLIKKLLGSAERLHLTAGDGEYPLLRGDS